MHGFQLWSNLPSSLKMTAPRYQDVLSKDVPEVIDDDGTTARILCGDFWGKRGVVDGIAADPCYRSQWQRCSQRGMRLARLGRTLTGASSDADVVETFSTDSPLHAWSIRLP